MNDDIISRIEDSVKFLNDYEKGVGQVHFGDWHERFLKETEKILDRDLRVKKDNLVNFRGKQIFVPDNPRATLKGVYSSSKMYYVFKRIWDLFQGSSRGGIRQAFDYFEEIERQGFLPLLKKYPTPEAGNPFTVNYRGYKFTNRYLHHIYLLGIFKRYLEKELTPDSVFMDIGSSYGICSSLIKQEMRATHHVLVDFPGQLILAYFYLSNLFPGARIAFFKEVGQQNKIDKEFIGQFDFVLVPTSMFDKLTENSIDVVTNFISLSEMGREWFDKYVSSQPFSSAPYLYTVNRYDAYPTYSNNVTVLDYPLKDYSKILMRTCPIFRHYYRGYLFLFYKRINYPSQFFQFIGKRIR